jgi:hypothetical protein
MTEHFQQSIDALTAKIEQEEQTFLRSLIRRKILVNELCAEAGVPARFPDVNVGANLDTSLDPVRLTASATVSPGVKSDEFFGKSLSGSIKRVLELRKGAGQGPATVEEIYRVLMQGGYSFPSRSPEPNIQGLTVSIGKNSAMFVKLPNGQIGLKEWYPQAQRLKLRNRPEQPSVENGDAEPQQKEQEEN